MTRIEWTHRPDTKGESWNLIGGCTKVSEGCINCYALPMSWRLQNNPKRPDRYEGVAARTEYDHPYRSEKYLTQWTGRINLDWDVLEIPYRWKKPRTVFVASMSDLFHPAVPNEFIYRVLDVIDSCPQHTFLILTKRPDRMLATMNLWYEDSDLPADIPENLWVGVTAENQEQADKRIPLLLQTPAAVRWVSVEPMLSAIDLEGPGYIVSSRVHDMAAAIDHVVIPHPLDWVVIGAESGPNRRPMEELWALDLIEQCDAARTPVFIKQVSILKDKRHFDSGTYMSKDPSEWFPALQRREWPE